MSARHGAKALILAAAAAVLFPIAGVAAKTQAAPVSQSKAGGGQNVEAILSTLDETLTENRLLQTRIQKAQDANERVLKENGRLREQMRDLQKKLVDISTVESKRIDGLEKQIKDMEVSSEKLDVLNKEYAKNREEWQEKSSRVETHNQKLRALLDTAILEKERKDYLTLIDNAKTSAAESINKLSEVNQENEEMKSELGSVYYTLGNLLFEDKDYRNAIAKYEKALQLNPRDSWSHYNLGVIYDFYIKDQRKAIEHYREYIRYKSTVEEAHEIRERILEIELGERLDPQQPIGNKFYEFQQKT